MKYLGKFTPEEAARLAEAPRLTPKLKKRLLSINLIGKSHEEVEEAVKGLHIDYIAWLRFDGRMTMGQYIKLFAVKHPFIDILEEPK